MRTAEDIIAGFGKYSLDDDKLWLDSLDDLIILLDAGARPISLNRAESSGVYFNTIVYKNHIFLNLSRERVSELDRYLIS